MYTDVTNHCENCPQCPFTSGVGSVERPTKWIHDFVKENTVTMERCNEDHQPVMMVSQLWRSRSKLKYRITLKINMNLK